MSASPGYDAAEARTCCVAAYESPWAQLLLGDSFHPGGRELTLRIGAMLGLGPGVRLLDVASGQGTSAIALAQEYGCTVHGVDLSASNVEVARAAARESGVSGLVSFATGDAERLPVGDGTFDALICECAFCTFPGKAEAAGEFARAVRPGGSIALADITRSGELPGDLETLLGWIACLAGAEPAEAYVGTLATAGFEALAIERHDSSLKKLVSSVKLKLLGLEVAARLGKAPVPLEDVQKGKQLAKSAAAAAQEGKLGYVVITGTRRDVANPCST